MNYMDMQCHKCCLQMKKIFKWVENTSQFRKDFIEDYIEDNDAGYFHEVDVQLRVKK